jgi:predicted nucleic acid-binding protein
MAGWISSSMKLYLDACCINRPFDDQTQDRIRLEAEAVLLILQHCQTQEWIWIGSDILSYELEQIPDVERWQRVRRLTAFVQTVVHLDAHIINRAKQFEQLGFKAYDALHVASAEQAKVDIFLTTDDRLQHLSQRHADQIDIRLCNPLVWLNEVMKA